MRCGMAADILPAVLSMSLSGAAVILLIIFIRQTAFKRLNKRALSALWLIAAVKLLVPFNHCTNALAAAHPDGSSDIVSVEERAVFSNPINIALEQGFVDKAVYVWLFGAVLTASAAFFLHIINRRRFACALPCGYDIEPLKKAYRIRRRVRLRVSDRTDAPFTYGVFAPVIVLPKNMTEEQVKNVLCHELAHIKRLDVLFKALLTVCAAVHWFDPLVWIMLRLAAGDMELACDESALWHGKADPKRYALTLIGMEEQRCPMPSLGFAGGSLEQRIREVMRRDGAERTSRKAVSGILAAALSIAAAVLVNAAVVTLNGSADAVVIEESAVQTYTAAEEDAFNEYYGYTVTVTSDEVTETDEAIYAIEAVEYADAAVDDAYPGTAMYTEAAYTVAADGRITEYSVKRTPVYIAVSVGK